MKITRLFLLGLAFIFSAGIARSQTSNDFIVGVCTHLGQERLSSSQIKPLMDAAGATSFRDGITWGRVEKTKGKLVFPENMQDLDQLITTLNKKGEKPLVLLLYGNKIYGEDGIDSEEAIQAFSNYARFIARHFKGRVTLFELWNEWNIGMGSSKNPRTVRSTPTYVRLLEAVRAAVKSEIPEAVVIAGSVAGPDDRWINGFIDEGGLKHADAFSVHPYFYDRPNRSRPEDAIDWLTDLDARIKKANGGKSMPLYLTELGWPNQTFRNNWAPEQTADFVIRFLIQAKSLGYVNGVWWYELVNTGKNPDDKEDNFGLTTHDFKPKPAFGAMKIASSILKNSKSIRIEFDKGGLYQAHIDRGSNGQCYAAWTKTGTKHITVAQSKLPKNIAWGKMNPSDGGLEITETPLIVCDEKFSYLPQFQ